ncbi:MAG TPA: plastocyanin/azurin family copper-binding protein [Solirubrobacteraceae bacterium]|jgi:plastocyanin|nr:plastocyanin/azurin family copper-binding protein [Solirubrobacteraceae bacterium]
MQRAWRRSAPSVLALCATIALVAGCGSSETSSSTSSTAATTKTAASSGLKYNTTPKYAAPSSSAPVQSGVVPIAYRNIAIDPDTIRVKVGSTLKWTNYDPVEHNVTSESGPLHFASKDFGEGKAVEFKMTKPGIIHYECTIHPATMNGTIEVVK